MINIRDIDHVVLRIRDLDRVAGFYVDVLGARWEKKQEAIGLYQLRVGTSLIDLVPVDGQLGRQGGAAPGVEGRNVDHICFRVLPWNGETVLAHLAEHGIEGEIVSRYGADGDGPSIYLSDPEGNLLELKGPPWAPVSSANGNREKRAMVDQEMARKIAGGKGFIAALDQSGGSTPKALKGYGIDEGTWQSEEEMFGLIHAMRSRIISSPAFTGDKVIGAILFERTMDGQVGGKPTPQALRDRGVVPFIKIDKGLEEEKNGVQLMKPNPGLDALLARARGLGVFGTKERSVINLANREGIAAVVKQQFEVGRQVLAAGLMPIIEPEVNIKSPERAEADQILLEEILKAFDALPAGEQVMLKLSIPAKPGLFDPLVDHPKVLKVVALSGGYSRPDACRELAKNRGMIASFSRALLEDLRAQMSDAEFDASLGEAIDEIYTASTKKAA